MAVAAVDIGDESMSGFDLSPCPRFSYPEDFDRTKFDAWRRLSGVTAGRSVELVPRATDQAKVGAT